MGRDRQHIDHELTRDKLVQITGSEPPRVKNMDINRTLLIEACYKAKIEPVFIADVASLWD